MTFFEKLKNINLTQGNAVGNFGAVTGAATNAVIGQPIASIFGGITGGSISGLTGGLGQVNQSSGGQGVGSIIGQVLPGGLDSLAGTIGNSAFGANAGSGIDFGGSDSPFSNKTTGANDPLAIPFWKNFIVPKKLDGSTNWMFYVVWASSIFLLIVLVALFRNKKRPVRRFKRRSRFKRGGRI